MLEKQVIWASPSPQLVLLQTLSILRANISNQLPNLVVSMKNFCEEYQNVILYPTIISDSQFTLFSSAGFADAFCLQRAGVLLLQTHVKFIYSFQYVQKFIHNVQVHLLISLTQNIPIEKSNYFVNRKIFTWKILPINTSARSCENTWE